MRGRLNRFSVALKHARLLLAGCDTNGVYRVDVEGR